MPHSQRHAFFLLPFPLQQVLLQVPQLLGEVDIIIVGILEALHLVPQKVDLPGVPGTHLRDGRGVVHPFEAGVGDLARVGADLDLGDDIPLFILHRRQLVHAAEHWTRIRTNNVIEILNREIRCRPRVVGSFPDGNSALMLVCARLRHVAGTQWSNKKYMTMKHLEDAVEDASIAG